MSGPDVVENQSPERGPVMRPSDRRRQRTLDITALIDWALGDETVEPTLDATRRSAARRLRLEQCAAMRRDVA
jgi:hypothetical protein